MPRSETLQAFCIPTIRITEAAETAWQYDQNFVKYGHRVPIIIFSDASPLRQDEEGHLLFPRYANDYQKLQKVARKANNDIYIVTPEDKRALTKQLLSSLLLRRPDLETVLNNGLLEDILATPWGGNHNSALLYTYGWHIILCEDDVRPYQLMLAQQGSQDISQPGVVWSGVEVVTPSGASAYDTLTAYTLNPSDDTLSSPFVISSPDVFNAFFSIMGKTVSQAQHKFGAHLERAYSMRHSDRMLYMATTIPNYMALPALLDTECYPLKQDGQQLTAALPPLDNLNKKMSGHGVKPYPYYLKTVGTAQKQHGTIRYVVPAINSGVPDYDALDFLKYILREPSVRDRSHIKAVLATTYFSGNTTILDGYFAMSANIVGIVNDAKAGPSFMGFRMNDLGMRLDALDPESLVAILPLNQMHIQSPQSRESIGNSVYLETLGCIAKPLLYNTRVDANGRIRTVNADTFTQEVAARILAEVQSYRLQAQQQLGQPNMAPERRASLEQIIYDLDTLFEHFDLPVFYEKAKYELQQKTGLYTTAHDMWPDLQAVIEERRSALMLTHVATGKRVSMAELHYR